MSIVANPRRRRRPRVAISSSSPIIEASTSAASLSAVTAVTSVLSGPSVVPVVPVASSVTSIASVASITSITSALTTLTVTHAGKLSIALALGFLSLHVFFAYLLVLELCEVASQLEVFLKFTLIQVYCIDSPSLAPTQPSWPPAIP